MSRHTYLAIPLLALVLALAVACGQRTDITPIVPSPTTEATAMPVPVSTQVPGVGRTPEPAASPTSTPTETPVQPVEPTPTPIPSPTPAPTPDPTPTPIAGLNGNGVVADEVSFPPAQEELSTVEVVQILTPSVVQITTAILSMGLFNDPVPREGAGTGVILDDQGNILTNNHVIDGAQRITVILNTGVGFEAKPVGGDFSTDLAIIRIDAQGLQPAILGNSSELQVGEDVIAIGHALGLPGGPTVSKGVVSALGRAIDTDARTTIVDLIQTDALINPGNSGGALVNNRAEVIGINTAIIQGSQGIGFAINIDDAKTVAAQLLEKGYVDRGFLGITPVNMSPGLANQLGLLATRGILVARVIQGTAAEAVGLLEGDVIILLGNQIIANTGELSKFLISHPPGETVDLVYYRGEDEIRTEVTLRERPKP